VNREQLLRRLRGPRSLRSRLLAAVVVLSLAALIAVGVAMYFSLGSYLRGNLDKQLERTAPNAVSLYNGDGLPRSVDPDTALTIYTADGVFVASPGAARLPNLKTGQPFNVPRTVTGSNGSDFRVISLQAVNPRTGIQYTISVGLPTSRVDNVLDRLLLLEIAVSAGVVILLIGVGLVLVKVGLRPLAKMGDTAEAIAAGDLSRRVETATERTEVGRLGLSLNSMLTQIEDEIAQRTASEDRLRRFIADASHELRTPLTSIRGYAELFRRGAQSRPEDLALAMRRIEAEAGRMGGLVEDLLLLARLDEGRPLDSARVDLATIAADAGADARTIAPDRAVEVTVEGPTVVVGDDARLRQVLSNLVRNVLAHTPPGTPFGIRVKGETGCATVDVWDRGPGLSQDMAEHAFDRFWRADPSRQRDNALSGSGLGLSIVAALTEAHGGTVATLPTPGGGATFRIALPIQTDDAAAVDVTPVADRVGGPAAGA
jgi:two-component system OmpR family sensor kinase